MCVCERVYVMQKSKKNEKNINIKYFLSGKILLQINLSVRPFVVTVSSL